MNTLLEEDEFLRSQPRVILALCQCGFPCEAQLSVWGPHLGETASLKCTPEICLYQSEGHVLLSSLRKKAKKWRTFASLPFEVVAYLLGYQEVSIDQVTTDEEARKLYLELKGKTNWDKVIQVREPHDHPLAEAARGEVLERFAGTALSGK